MLFMATLSEKNKTAGKQMQEAIRYKDLCLGKQLFKPNAQTLFADTIRGVYDPTKGFGALLMGNMFTIREFSSPEEKQLLQDAAAIMGEEKTLDAMMKDVFMRVDPNQIKKDVKTTETESKTQTAPDAERPVPAYAGEEAKKRAETLRTTLESFGVADSVLDNKEIECRKKKLCAITIKSRLCLLFII